MSRIKAYAPLLLLLFPTMSGDAQATRAHSSPSVDEFVAVQCGGDIVKALVGKPTKNGRVKLIEAAHVDIGLKDLGGSIVNDSLFQISWAICGHEYVLLETKRVVDAILFPPHSRCQPEFLGTCLRKRKESVEGVQAVLANPSPRAPGEPVYLPEDTISLAAIAAWRIDEKAMRFVPLDTAGLRCPRGGIVSADGGM